MSRFLIRGDIVYSETQDHLFTQKDAYLDIQDATVQGVYTTLPSSLQGVPVHDYSGQLVIPGLTDLHLHAPQYAFRGMWMDEELLDWLNRHTFPIEARYADAAFAKNAYRIFQQDLRKSATTRAVMFSTIHADATVQLMELMEGSGLVTYVGKVNMDRNSPDILREATAKEAVDDTLRWIDEVTGRFQRTLPILTPRFIPSCTDELMEGLGEIAKSRHLPVQSHLSENFSEIDWVRNLCPWSLNYGDAYDRFGLFGSEGRAVMAHCVHSPDEEIRLMKERGTFVAHCPDSNANLASGIAPVRRYLDEGIRMGLGTDVAGGATISLFSSIRDAVQQSKLRWRLQDGGLPWLTFAEAFYLATAGGGAFFGKVGRFEKDYEADVLILDEQGIPTPLMEELTIAERLERFIYLGHEGSVLHKYVRGEKLF